MLFYFSKISKRLREGADTPDDRGPGGEAGSGRRRTDPTRLSVTSLSHLSARCQSL